MALAFGAASNQAVPSIEAGHDPVHVPEAGLIHGAEFIRAGLDLKLVAADGGELLITNYFATGNPPHLVAPNGTSLDGHTVSLLAGPLAPAQFAQAGTAPAAGTSSVGEVTKLEGQVTVQSADGSTKQLQVGDLVFQSDIISTAKGGLIGIKLVDGTILSLQESGKLVLSEVVYNADSTSNSALLNVLEGTFSLFAGKIAPTGDMKIQTPIATMGIRGTSILGVNVNSLGGRLSLTQDPNGHIGFINVFNNLNGDLFTILNTLFSKITLTDSGMLLLSAKTADELAFDQQLTQLLHDFVPQAGPNPQPQSGPPSFFDRPGFQDIIFEGAPSTPEDQLLIPSELLIPLIESLLQDPIIQQAIINALDEQPDAAVLEVAADEGQLGVGPGNPEVGGSLPFSFGSSGAGTIGFQTLDGQPVLDSNGNPVTLSGQPLTYAWDADANTLTAMSGETPIFSLTVDPVTGNFTLTLLSQIDHPLQGADVLQLELDFTVIAANGQQATGTLAVNVADDVPVATNDIVVAPNTDDDVATYNVGLVLDVSGSMGGNRLQLMKDAVAQLLNSHNVLSAFIVVFSSGATHVLAAEGEAWFVDLDAAISQVNGLTAGGGTNYVAALNNVMANYEAPPTDADHTVFYFLSDGAPSSPVGATLQGQWEAFIDNNDIDTSYAFGIGSGVSTGNLQPIAYPNGDESNPLVITNEQQLADMLVGTVSDEIFSGNVLTGELHGAVNETSGAPDSFGADGEGGIQSVVVDGIKYSFDGESITYEQVDGNQINQFLQVLDSEYPPGSVEIDGTKLQVVTLQGGQFTFYFGDHEDGHVAGDWQYISPADKDPGLVDLPYENFRYTIVDGDGDTATASLTGFEAPEGAEDPLLHIYQGNSADNVLEGNSELQEILVGNLGADTFVINSSSLADYIADYYLSEGDAVDLTALFEGGNVDLADVRLLDNGPGGVDELQVHDGESFTTVAYLDGGATNTINIVVDDAGTVAQLNGGVNV